MPSLLEVDKKLLNELLELINGGGCKRIGIGKCIKGGKCVNDHHNICTKARKCVVFIGAGLSQGAGLPGWRDLLKQMVDRGEDLNIDATELDNLRSSIDEGDLTFVADEARRLLEDIHFYRFMREVFGRPMSSTRVHKRLLKIPFAAALTTNYDQLLEQTYANVRSVFTHKDKHKISEALRGDDFYIFKLHGTIDRIETIVIGRRDYRELIHNNQAYKQYMKTLLSTKSILFIGYSIADPDLLLFLDSAKAIFDGSIGKHYALMSVKDVSDVEQRSLERYYRYYGIEIITYTPSNSEHPEVYEFLSKLVT